MRMRRCEDQKMLYRAPLLEEPCAQTLSGETSPWRKKTEQKKLKNNFPEVLEMEKVTPESQNIVFFGFLEVFCVLPFSATEDLWKIGFIFFCGFLEFLWSEFEQNRHL